ncbi:hypothetical protein [Streptomyces sp. B29(2018)]|uniref:hypothetical protein n=1 Tax=Streptomyces sp. B29(2018) TaxID=2485016 RepID=UPI000FD6B6C8|nr:hypothetical protein [Streptomyces sp. B29(2018)]
MTAAAKTSRPFKIELKAGVPQMIEQSSEFVFVEQGRDLVVRCDSVIHDGVQAGDKIRPSAPFDRITLISAYDQVIRIRAGWGDWDRLIVSGELNISSYVTSRGRGVEDSLPMELVREVGGSVGETPYLVGTVEYVSPVETAADISGGAFWFVDRYYHYGGSSDRIYTFNADTTNGEYIEIIPVGGSVGDADLLQSLGVAVTPDGTVFHRSNAGNLYTMSMGEWNVGLVRNGVYESNHYKNGLYYFGGRLYSISKTGTQIQSVNTEGGDLRNDAAINNASASNICGIGNLVWVDGGGGAWGAWRCYKINSDGTLSRNQSEDILSPAQTSNVRCFSPDRLHCLRLPGNGTMTIEHLTNVTTYGEIWHQPKGDPARRTVVPQFEKLRYFNSAAGVSIKYDWLGAILGNESSAYLDYLTGYKYENATVEKEISSGTQTFGYRGIEVPEFAALDGSEIRISILPSYFDQ